LTDLLKEKGEQIKLGRKTDPSIQALTLIKDKTKK
jgi:hypothetical protein